MPFFVPFFQDFLKFLIFLFLLDCSTLYNVEQSSRGGISEILGQFLFFSNYVIIFIGSKKIWSASFKMKLLRPCRKSYTVLKHLFLLLVCYNRPFNILRCLSYVSKMANLICQNLICVQNGQSWLAKWDFKKWQRRMSNWSSMQNLKRLGKNMKKYEKYAKIRKNMKKYDKILKKYEKY